MRGAWIRGYYLNSKKPYMLFCEDCSSVYYVDKTDILQELVPLTESSGRKKGHKYICITRPRRFGKTMMANMISSYFGKGIDSRESFQKLNVSENNWYEHHLNQHNVIHNYAF